MIYIAHRGNTEGPNPDMENSPSYIQQAIDEGYHVEIDLWGDRDQLRLGQGQEKHHLAVLETP